jgi:hypothetical protein
MSIKFLVTFRKMILSFTEDDRQFWVEVEGAIHMGFSVPSNNFKRWSNCGEKRAT